MSTKGLQSIERLKQEFQQFPGIGARSAERLAFHVLRDTKENAQNFAQAVLAVKETVFHCSVCYNLTEHDPCDQCQGEKTRIPSFQAFL